MRLDEISTADKLYKRFRQFVMELAKAAPSKFVATTDTQGRSAFIAADDRRTLIISKIFRYNQPGSSDLKVNVNVHVDASMDSEQKSAWFQEIIPVIKKFAEGHVDPRADTKAGRNHYGWTFTLGLDDKGYQTWG